MLELLDVIAGPKYETPPRHARRVRTHPDLYEDYGDDEDDEAGDEIVDVKPRGREAVLTARVADLEVSYQIEASKQADTSSVKWKDY